MSLGKQKSATAVSMSSLIKFEVGILESSVPSSAGGNWLKLLGFKVVYST